MTPRTAGRGRPFVWANCAVSTDGRLAYSGGRRARLSGPDDLRRVQSIRAESQAILVGAGTIRADDPSLRVHWEMLDRPRGPEPLRVILDSRSGVPRGARVFDGSQPTLLASAEDHRTDPPPGIDRFVSGRGRVDLSGLLAELDRRRVRQLLVEGGSETLAAFLRGRLVDRLTIYLAPVIIGGRDAPTMVGGPETIDAAGEIPLRRIEARPIDDGWLLTFEPVP